MSVSTTKQHGVPVLEIHDRFLGSVDGPEFEEHFDALRDEDEQHIVIDLGETEFMDSTGVGVLISNQTSIRKAGGEMRLANIKKRIKNLFMMMHLLGEVFDSYDSVEAAAQSFEDDPPAAPGGETAA